MAQRRTGHEEPHVVAEIIRRTIADIPAAERKVARALLSHYPAAGLEPAVNLAERAGASAPTVTRYVARLGFSGYREFQQALRDEMDARQASPITLASKYGADTPASRFLGEASTTLVSLLTASFAHAGASGFDQAVELVADPKRRVGAVGGRFSRVMAEFLDLHLRMIRSQTRAIRLLPEEAALQFIEMGRRDVLVVFDFRRYQDDVINLAREAHERHSKVILITDVWLSPIAEFADVVMPLRTESDSPFDTLVPAAALVETLATAALTRLGDDAKARMRTLEQHSNR